MSDWQPIETAPRNKEILLYEKEDGDNFYLGMYIGWKECWMAQGFVLNPTHWMPLPEPPKGVSDEQ